eukprot:3574714-Amphidinium_carterae.1
MPNLTICDDAQEIESRSSNRVLGPRFLCSHLRARVVMQLAHVSRVAWMAVTFLNVLLEPKKKKIQRHECTNI